MNRGGAVALGSTSSCKPLNLPCEQKVERFDWSRSCRLRTNYDKEVDNGDIGYVTNVDPQPGSRLPTYVDMKLDVAGHTLGFDAAREIGPFFGVQIRP
jgi:hypothetical protein